VGTGLISDVGRSAPSAAVLENRTTARIALVLPLTPVSFALVAGLPLIRRTAACALRSAFDRVVVLGGSSIERARVLLAADSRTRDDRIEVVARQPRLAPEDDVTVIPADCLLTAATLEGALAAPADGPLLLADEEGFGIARCPAAALSDVDLGSATNDWTALSEILRRRGALHIPLDGAVCVRIDGAESVTTGESALCAELRARSQPTDGPLARFDRRISCRISRWIVRHTTLRPNDITTIGTIVGLAAAWVLSRGTYAAGVAGTALFLSAALIDGCDGEVARLTFRESPFGKAFDVATDNLVHAAVFVGLALGMRRRDPSGHWGMLMLLLLIGFALAGAVSYYFLVRQTAWRTDRPAQITARARLRHRLLKTLESLMNRDFAYLLLVLAVAGRLRWFFWGALVGSYVFAALFIWVYGWREPTR